jgi:hypothetical protein
LLFSHGLSRGWLRLQIRGCAPARSASLLHLGLKARERPSNALYEPARAGFCRRVFEVGDYDSTQRSHWGWTHLDEHWALLNTAGSLQRLIRISTRRWCMRFARRCRLLSGARSPARHLGLCRAWPTREIRGPVANPDPMRNAFKLVFKPATSTAAFSG